MSRCRLAIVFLLFLTCIGAAEIPSVSDIRYDGLSHSTVRITFNVSAPYQAVRTLIVPAAKGSCKDGRNYQWIQPRSASTMFTQGMAIDIGGLAAGTAYELCPQVSTDNVHWSTGAGITFTTLPLPAVHPEPPALPKTFDLTYPDTAGYRSVTVADDCSDLMSQISRAMSIQDTTGTIINIKPATKCTGQYVIPGPSKDVMSFAPSAVSTAKSTITIPNHRLRDGQGIIFGAFYYDTLPASDTCTNGEGMAPGIQFGVQYYAHVLDANTFQVYCGGPPDHGGVLAVLHSPGATVNGAAHLEVAPWPSKLKWIIIRTATPDSQFTPEGVRTSPAWAPKMAHFVKQKPSCCGPGTGYNWSDVMLIFGEIDNGVVGNGHTGWMSHAARIIRNFWFTGIEFTTEDSADSETSTDPNPWAHLVWVLPTDQNIVFDRTYWHSLGTPNRITTAFTWNGMNTALVNSYLDNLVYFHSTYTGLTAKQLNGTEFTVSAGTHFMNARSNAKSVANPARIRISGSGSGSGFVYMDFNGVLNVALPAGITGACTGISNCRAFTTSDERGQFPTQTADGQNYWADPVFSERPGSAKYSLFSHGIPKSSQAEWHASKPVELGVQFTSDKDGFIDGIRFYKDAADKGAHRVSLWNSAGKLLATQESRRETAKGWQEVDFSNPAAVKPGEVLTASYHSEAGFVGSGKGFFRNSSFDNPPLHALGSYAAGNGSCNRSDSWPLNFAGNPAVGEVACFTVTHGAITQIRQGDSVYSLFDTEGTNFMVSSQGPGPMMAVNNYIEGAGLLFHHDEGGGINWPRGDDTYLRNTFREPFKYMYTSPVSDGLKYFERQPLEWKNGWRINVTGNLFDGAWAEDNPVGVFIAITARGCCGLIGETTRDFNIEDNTFEHGPGGINVPFVVPTNVPDPMPPVRLRVRNNLFFDLDAKTYAVPSQFTGFIWPAPGWLFDGGTGSADYIIDHNTLIGQPNGVASTILTITDTHLEGLQVTNNILQVNSTVAKGGLLYESGSGQPQAPLSPACRDVSAFGAGEATANCIFTPEYTWKNNVMLAGPGVSLSDLRNWWPQKHGDVQGNLLMPDSKLSTLGFAKFNPSTLASYGTGLMDNNFHTSKPYGADIDHLETVQGKVELKPVMSGVVSFVAPDAHGCPVDYSSSDPAAIRDFVRVPDPGGADRNRHIALKGLKSGTTYYFRVNCQVEQPIGRFRAQ